jgi:hypothetical protein
MAKLKAKIAEKLREKIGDALGLNIMTALDDKGID